MSATVYRREPPKTHWVRPTSLWFSLLWFTRQPRIVFRPWHPFISVRLKQLQDAPPLPSRTQVSLLTSSCNSNKNKHASMVQWNMWRGSTRISPLTLSWNSIGNQSDFVLGCSPASVRESDRLFAHRPVRPTVCPLVRAQERNDLFHVGQIMIWLCFSVFDKDIWMCPSPSVCRIMAWIQHFTTAKTKAFVDRSIGIFWRKHRNRENSQNKEAVPWHTICTCAHLGQWRGH